MEEIIGETEGWDEPDDSGEIFAAGEPLVLDLGKDTQARGFCYRPKKKGADGCIITYSLAVSPDGTQWQTVFSDKMFENIVNNPVRQDVSFSGPLTFRYIKLTPLRTSDESTYGVAGFGILQ